MHLRLPPSNHADLMQESSSIMSALNTAKSALRRAMKQRLKQVDSATTMSESALVVARIFKAPYWRDSKKVSIYLSTPNGEVQTDKLVRDAFTTGKSLFVPFCPIEDPTVMRMLRLKSLEHYEGLQTNRWGIRELDPAEVEGLEDADGAESDGLDLIIVPGLAFDSAGRRLGHGRGYYDRYISRTEATARQLGRTPPKTIAVALAAQMLPEGEEVPVSQYDRILDILVTPTSEIHKSE